MKRGTYHHFFVHRAVAILGGTTHDNEIRCFSACLAKDLPVGVSDLDIDDGFRDTFQLLGIIHLDLFPHPGDVVFVGLYLFTGADI